MQSLTLRSGAQLPSVGFGFWKVPRNVTADMTVNAIQAGYRHLDCACDYGNEAEVGEGIERAISDGVVSREELWVTSKLWNTYHHAQHVRPALERTLSDLRLDYLDLYLIHFPISQRYVAPETRYPPEWFYDPNASQPRIEEDPVPILETWQAMEALLPSGLVREIGVCNFGVSLLRDLIASADRYPAVLQVELHPYLTQNKLLRFCQQKEIAVTGFSPLGAQSYFELNMAADDESVLAHPTVTQIATTHDRTPAQVVLRWGIQRGTAIVPKTSQPKRLVENLTIFDFELSDEEMLAITSLDRHRRFNDPGDFAEAAFNTFFPIYE